VALRSGPHRGRRIERQLSGVGVEVENLAVPAPLNRNIELSTHLFSENPHPSKSRKKPMEQSAVSHQLRLLRTLGLVTRERLGRTSVCSLYDDKVPRLLDEAV